jgi:Tfp pilus assembly protein PilO
MRFLFESQTQLAASSSAVGSNRARSVLRVALGLVLVIGLGLLIFLLRSSETARGQNLARTAERHRAALTQVEQLRGLAVKVRTATQGGQRFAQENFLPRRNAFSAMLAELERLAIGNRLQPSDIKYQVNEPDNELGWAAVDISLAIEGEYTDIVRMINQMEQEEIFWFIRSLDVSSSSAAGSRLRLSLQTRTYLVPE